MPDFAGSDKGIRAVDNVAYHISQGNQSLKFSTGGGAGLPIPPVYSDEVALTLGYYSLRTLQCPLLLTLVCEKCQEKGWGDSQGKPSEILTAYIS